MTKTPTKKTETKTAKTPDYKSALEGLVNAVETAGLRMGRHPKLTAALEHAKAIVAPVDEAEEADA